MNAITSFFVPGNPKGQPRPRAFAFRGKARVYDPGTAEGWKADIAIAARPFRPAAPTTTPVRVALDFVFARPKSHFHTGRRAGELKPSAPVAMTSKPDADNLAKAVLDALTDIGFWRDDAQIAELAATKRYGEKAGCFVLISPATNP